MLGSPRNRTIVLGCLIIIIPLVMHLFVITPLQRLRSSLSQSILQNIQQNDLVYLQLQDAFSENNRERQHLEDSGLSQALLKKDGLVSFITDIESLATEHNVSSSIIFGSDLDLDLVEVQDIETSIRVRGDFYDALRFLRSVEQKPYYVNGSSIMLAPSTATGEVQNIELIFDGTTSWK